MEIINTAELIRIRQFLEISERDYRIPDKIAQTFPDDGDPLKAVRIIQKFTDFFQIYGNLVHFKKFLVECILDTLDICNNLSELEDSLLKTTMFKILELYMDYSKLAGDKDKIIKTLTASFEVLAPPALAINLGSIAKPVFSDEEYLAKKSQEEQKEIREVADEKVALKIKRAVGDWLDSQDISLDRQKELHEKLESYVSELADKYGLNKESELYKEVLLECKEMANLKLTALSLLMDLGDEDLSPEPLSL